MAGSYSNFESLESEFEKFYEYYPNADIQYTYLDDYNKTIRQAILGTEAPDIYVVGHWMYGNSDYDALFNSAEDLSDPALGIDLDCIREGAKWIMPDGSVIALPIFSTSYGMLVNMDIFEKEGLKVPKTYSELLTVCEKLKSAGYVSPVMGANTKTSASIGYAFSYPMFCENVKENKDQEAAFNELQQSAGELMRPSLTRLKEFVDSGYIDVAKCTEEIEDDYNAMILRFFEGDVPMMLCTGDTVSGTGKRESKSEAFEANPFKYEFYVAPSGDKGGYFTNDVSLFFAVNKNSDYLDMTNEFVRFLASEKELGSMAEQKRLITPTNDFSLDAVYGSLAGFSKDRTINFSDTDIMGDAIKEYKVAVYKVINDILTVDETVANFGTLSEGE